MKTNGTTTSNQIYDFERITKKINMGTMLKMKELKIVNDFYNLITKDKTSELFFVLIKENLSKTFKEVVTLKEEMDKFGVEQKSCGNCKFLLKIIDNPIYGISRHVCENKENTLCTNNQLWEEKL